MSNEVNESGVIQAFTDFLDNLFYEGYTVHLSNSSPCEFQYELKEFKKQYGFEEVTETNNNTQDYE